MNIFETSPIDYSSKVYSEIKQKSNMMNFFYNVILTEIFDETLKENPPMVEGYHYLNDFNYFMGMRLTSQRSEVKHTQYNPGFEDYIRKTLYSGRTNQDFEYLYKNGFNYGLDVVEYKSSGGYADKGGYIMFYPPDVDIETALTHFFYADYYGFFNFMFISVTVEILLYNQNFQTGVNIIYEFLVDNGGNIEKHRNAEGFYLSRYSEHYNEMSSAVRHLLIFCDFVWIILLLLYTIKAIIAIKKRVEDAIRHRVYDISWHEALDVVIVTLAYVLLVLWILIF